MGFPFYIWHWPLVFHPGEEGEVVGDQCSDAELETVYSNLPKRINPNDVVVWVAVHNYHEPRHQGEEDRRIPGFEEGWHTPVTSQLPRLYAGARAIKEKPLLQRQRAKGSVSHLLHTKRPSYLRAFLYKFGNVEGEVLNCLVYLNVMLPSGGRPDAVVIFLQPSQQTHS